MKRSKHPPVPVVFAACMALCLVLQPFTSLALESDRQQPLEIAAGSTDGLLGDGTTQLRGNVDIRQGSLHIRANQADVRKSKGKVQLITLRGQPAYLEQAIEGEGLVQAEARTIRYQVADGVVVLKGKVNVVHPQYQIDGEELIYNLNDQHFEGSGSNEPEGRIRIRLDPEVAPEIAPAPEPPAAPEGGG
jgi:lipopolysaccharide export system protein LptA